MRRRFAFVLSTLLCAGAAFAAAPTQLVIVPGTQPDGRMTDAWHGVLLFRYHHLADSEAVQAPKPETAEERAWAALVASRRDAWQAMVPALAQAYAPAEPPANVDIITGNRGSEDAWTAGPKRIAFDLSALQSNYGDATTPENRARIDRFFRHEFVHVMQKAWLASNPQPLDTPMQRAAYELWAEGLGNRESLSSKWIDGDGRLTEHARKTLDVLVPVMRERLAALREATPEQAEALTKDLSSGPFDKKWGALPIALWLAEDVARDPAALRRFVDGGPEGALDYAQRRAAKLDGNSN